MGYNSIKEVLGINKKIIWIYNIGVEDVWYRNGSIKDNSSVKIVNEMEDMNILLASSEDIIIMRNSPSKEYKDYLKSIGFNIPNIIEINEKDDNKAISELILNDEKLLLQLKKLSNDYMMLTYGISELEEKISSITGLKLIGASSEIVKRVNDKIFSRDVAKELNLNVTEGEKCTIDEIQDVANELFYKYKKVIIKAPHGASGKGLYLIDKIEDVRRIMLVLKRFHKNDEFFLVEGWIENKKDYNYQLYLNDLETKIFSIKEQITKDTVYVGSLFQIDDIIKSEIEYNGMLVGEVLRNKYSYRGFLGIDCLYNGDKIVPIIEINGRMTLSTYLSFISNIFPDKLFYSLYKNVFELSFNDVLAKLKAADINYNTESKKGVICYVEGSLQPKGRLFLLIVANSNNEITNYINKVNELFD